MAKLKYKKNLPVNTKFKPVLFRKGDTELKRNVPTDPKMHDLYYGILKTVRAYLTDLYGDRNYNDKYKLIAELIITSINTNKTEGSKPEAISSAIDSADVKLNDDTKKSLVDTLSALIGKSLAADSSKVSSKLDEFFKRDDTKTALQKAALEKTDKKLDAASKRLEMLDLSLSVMDKVMSGISGAVSTMMGLVGSIIGSVGSVLSIVGSIVTSIASFGLSLIMLPIKIVGSVLMGIGSILFKTMGLILSPLWNFTKKIGSIIWNVVSKPFKMIGSLISDGFSFMKTALKKIATTGLKTFLLSPFGMFAIGYIGGFVYKRFIEPLIDWFKSTRVYKAFAGLFAGNYTFLLACKVFLFGEKYAETDWMVIFEEKWNNLKEKIKDIIYPILGFDKNKSFWDNLIDAFKKGLRFIWETDIPGTDQGVFSNILSTVNTIFAAIASMFGAKGMALSISNTIRPGLNKTVGSVITAVGGLAALALIANNPIAAGILFIMAMIKKLLPKSHDDALKIIEDELEYKRRLNIKKIQEFEQGKYDPAKAAAGLKVMRSQMKASTEAMQLQRNMLNYILSIGKSIPPDALEAAKRYILDPANLRWGNSKLKTLDELYSGVYLHVYDKTKHLLGQTDKWQSFAEYIGSGYSNDYATTDVSLRDAMRMVVRNNSLEFDEYLKTINNQHIKLMTKNGIEISLDTLKNAIFSDNATGVVTVTDPNTGKTVTENALDIINHAFIAAERRLNKFAELFAFALAYSVDKSFSAYKISDMFDDSLRANPKFVELVKLSEDVLTEILALANDGNKRDDESLAKLQSCVNMLTELLYLMFDMRNEAKNKKTNLQTESKNTMVVISGTEQKSARTIDTKRNYIE